MSEGKALGRSPLRGQEELLADVFLSKPESLTPTSEELIVNSNSGINNKDSSISIKKDISKNSKQEALVADQEMITLAMKDGTYNPRVSLYSPMIAAMLAYLDRTTPRFCKSDEGTKVLEKAFKKEYPDIWSVIEEKATTEQEWIDLNKKRRKATILRR
jgi:hypothetical protein